MDAAEREHRRQMIHDEIRDRQQQAGHEAPLPSFLNLLTDKIIDIEERLDAIERKARFG